MTKNIITKIKDLTEVFIPVITVGELYFGAQKSTYVKENISRIEELVETSKVLECSSETAQFYGTIKNNLKIKGHPLPENDIWIAAIAEEHGLILISRDDHFKYVDTIKLEQA